MAGRPTRRQKAALGRRAKAFGHRVAWPEFSIGYVSRKRALLNCSLLPDLGRLTRISHQFGAVGPGPWKGFSPAEGARVAPLFASPPAQSVG
jgi:hypothetical protein